MGFVNFGLTKELELQFFKRLFGPETDFDRCRILPLLPDRERPDCSRDELAKQARLAREAQDASKK